jgi:transposase
VADAHPEAGRLEVGFLDEARVGQTGRLSRRWFERGVRPRGVRDLRHQAAYLLGAVCPERNAGVALVLPSVSTAAMQAMLDELGQAVAPGAHAVVLMDCAGSHVAKDLAIPANLTPLFLPAYSPELNAIERVWLYLRERFLSHRFWPTYEDILDACCHAWNALLAEPGRIRSLCSSTGLRRPVLRGAGITWRFPSIARQPWFLLDITWMAGNARAGICLIAKANPYLIKPGTKRIVVTPSVRMTS